MAYEDEKEKTKRFITELASSVATLEEQLKNEKNMYQTLKGENDLLYSTHEKLTVSYNILQTAHIALQHSYEALESKQLHDTCISVHHSHSPSPPPCPPSISSSPPPSSSHSPSPHSPPSPPASALDLFNQCSGLQELPHTLRHNHVDSVLDVTYSDRSEKAKLGKTIVEKCVSHTTSSFPEALHSKADADAKLIVDELLKDNVHNHNLGDETDSSGVCAGEEGGNSTIQTPNIIATAKTIVCTPGSKKKLSVTVSKSKSATVIATEKTLSIVNKKKQKKRRQKNNSE